jgi:uncharacterized protein GlcG (DUF336 family)
MPPRFHLCAVLCSPLVWFVAAGVPAIGQQATSELTELRGRVLNSVTGEPIAGALVQISVPGQQAQFTGTDGTFVFGDLPSGDYLPIVRKPGFFNDQELNPWRLASPLTISTGQNKPVVLKLTPEAIIYGEVKNENGMALEGVTVMAQRWQVENGQKRLLPLGTAVTDDEGNFRLAEMRPGRYYLSFQSANNRGWSVFNQLTSKKPMEEGYGPQFYPGVPDLESASVMEIRAGAQVHIAQALNRQRLFEVAGVVRGTDPDDGFNLMLTNSAGEVAQRTVRTNPRTGQFQIQGVSSGLYMLRATSNRRPSLSEPHGLADEAPPPLIALLPLQVHGDVSGLVVVLGSGITIDVQVHDEVSTNDAASGLHRVSLQMVPREFSMSSSWITVPPDPSDARAQRRFEGLAPGTYVVSGSPNGPWYISSLRCGSVDLLRDDLTIPPGAAPPPIEVTLRDDGAQLTVKVMQNGQSTAASLVLFSPEYPGRSQFFGLTHSISASNLAPGTYYVIALPNAENVEFRNPVAMERYLARATEVMLGPRVESSVVAEVQTQAEGPQ